jgi:hypothetical protein
MTTLADHYRQIRHEHPETPARYALQGARHALQVDAILRDIEWEERDRFAGYGHGPFAIGTLPDRAAIAVYWDDEPYDWGDIEPTDHERENISVIGCAARVAGDDDDLEAVWGYAFTGGDWEREAVSFAVECGFFERARLELAERAEWAARDTITVEA